ncbi:dihydrodipicolinate reductase [Candidatus Geothermarchaeota archaeon]|nr:MAG: dihydrodipicolinate reductase [Candidatus Geothermarchaeota archaeon]HEW94193.1 dihydrodipicolinate reductase [Thermoprotei archaeon]
MSKIKVILVGLGPIGTMIGKYLASKEWIEIVGGIDIAKDLIGKDVGEHLGIGKLGVAITDDYDEAISKTKPDIAVVATVSYLDKVYPQLEKILEYGVDIISTCEELSYPYIVDKKLAEKIDALAKKHGATVLGTGINPGFLMDTLVITLTTACKEVHKIKVERQMDASTRRGPFQKKIGAGLTVEEFREKIDKKIISGHVGLEQSIALIADAIGWKLNKIEVDPVEPVISEKKIVTDFVTVEPGKVAGLKQSARGIVGDEAKIILEFRAYVGAPEEYDAITIEGVPPINEKISPCVHGDHGTVAVIANMIPKVLKAPPGLLTMKDMTLPSYYSGE